MYNTYLLISLFMKRIIMTEYIIYKTIYLPICLCVQSSDIIFDLALLQSSCPNLTTLDIASVSLRINHEPRGKFEYLKRVIMESPPTDTKSWFLFHGCPVLEEFKVYK